MLGIALAAVLTVVIARPVPAAEIVFLCGAALRSTVEGLVAEFEATTGHKVHATFAIIDAIAQRVRQGDTADLVVVSSQRCERLREERTIGPDVRIVVARLEYGLAVRRGAPKPDIRSVAALRQAFLTARSITFPARPGPIAAYQQRVFDQLGVSEELKPRLRYPDLTGRSEPARWPLVLDLVASGEAEVGVATIPEILEAPGVELVGPMPPEIQSFLVLTAAIPRTAKQPAAARELINLLIGPKAVELLRAKGFEPR